VNHNARAFCGKSNFRSQQLAGKEHLARSGEFARRGCTRITADPELWHMEKSQAPHFCAAAWSCGFASTQSPAGLPAKCRFFQNGASVFR
jgi:hypothetical protein